MGDLTTYWVHIDSLGAERAEFTGPHGVILSMPRDAWEKAGMPALLEFTLIPDSTMR